MSGADIAAWAGWWAGAFGVVGSLLLIRPLFLLLQHREAVESIGYALDLNLLPADLQESASEARQKLSTSVFVRRKRWKVWAYGGLGFLVLSALSLIVQGVCMW